MAGGDHHATGSPQIFYRIRKRRRRRVVVGNLDWNSSSGKDLSSSLSKPARAKARVIADDKPVSRVLIFQDIGGNTASYPADIFKSVVIGDYATPAIGAEFNLG